MIKLRGSADCKEGYLVGRNMDDMPGNLWGRGKFLGGGQNLQRER